MGKLFIVTTQHLSQAKPDWEDDHYKHAIPTESGYVITETTGYLDKDNFLDALDSIDWDNKELQGVEIKVHSTADESNAEDSE